MVAVAVRIVVGGLVIAHGLVHLLYVADDVDVFTFDSWAIPDGASRGVGLVLMWVTVVEFALVGLALWRFPGLSSAWPALTVAASAVSLVLLALYFDVQLLFGMALDVALISIAVVRPGWTDQIAG